MLDIEHNISNIRLMKTVQPKNLNQYLSKGTYNNIDRTIHQPYNLVITQIIQLKLIKISNLKQLNLLQVVDDLNGYVRSALLSTL